MIYFDNFSRGAWLYFTLHGAYGALWIMGYFIFPNKGFNYNMTICSCLVLYSFALGPYCIAAYQVASRAQEETQNPSDERCVVATLMFIFGVILMLGTDA